MATLTSAGAVPSSPQDLLNAEVAAATALSPGLTANLPGSLVEDMASTAAGAVVVIDQAYVDLINSISPYTANAFILYQLGAVYGVTQGIGSNTSVYVTFSTITLLNPTGTPGFVIPIGFVVSDGIYQYVVQDGGIIGSGGQSSALFCLATKAGSWAVPEGTVTTIITSVPGGINLSCSNLTPGTAGATAQTIQSYQAQVIQAGQAVAQGMPSFLKTQLQNVSGVQDNLVAISQSGTNWQVMCGGGGDPYQIANAIFTGLFDISNVIGSTLSASTLTNAYPAVVTTNLTHGFTTGQVIYISGATGLTSINSTAGIVISTMTWASSVVTVTTATPHGVASGAKILGLIAGVTPNGYNGTFTITSTGTSTFTYPLASNPGAVTIKGAVSTEVPYVAVVNSINSFSLNVEIVSLTWAASVVTVVTATPMGLTSGTVTGSIYGVTPSGYNVSGVTFTYISANSFSYPLATNPGAVTVLGYTPFDSTSLAAYTGNGIVTPNLRNVTVSINNYPNTYNVSFINPLSQLVNITILWNTIATNYVSPISVATAASVAISNYINGITVGQPINQYEMQAIFQQSIATLVPIQFISEINFTVVINGVTVAPAVTTGLYYGDPQSYFVTNSSNITVTQA